MGTPRNKFSNASSSGLKRVMFTILFSYENSNQSAVNDCASVRISLDGGATATIKSRA